MNTEHLITFIKVVEYGGITQAARTMYITPPSVHQQIKLLEKEVGFSLFVRKGKKLQLTKAGESFYYSGKRLLERLDLAIARGHQIEKDQNKTLVIGYFLPGDLYRIDEFARKNPQYDIVPKAIEWDGSVHKLDQQVLNAYYDLVFCESMKHHPDLEFMEIAANEVVFAAMCNAKHPLADKPFLNKNDLTDQTIYSFRYDVDSPVFKQIQVLSPKYIPLPFTTNQNEILNICQEGMLFIAEEKYLIDFPLVILPIRPEIKAKHGIIFSKNSDHPVLRKYLEFIA